MNIRTALLSLSFLLLISLSALHGQEGKISKYSLALYGGSFRPEATKFQSGTRLENNRTFLIGTGIYNHPSPRFDIFLRSEFIFHKADVMPPACNCGTPALLNSNSTLEIGFFYNFITREASKVGIGLGGGVYYNFFNPGNAVFDLLTLSETEELNITIAYFSSPGLFLSPQMQYNFSINKNFSISTSLGIAVTIADGPTIISVGKWRNITSTFESLDFSWYSNNYAFFKIGMLYDFSIMWLKN